MKKVFLLFLLAISSIMLLAVEPLLFAVSEWPPFEYTENGVSKGSDVEIIQAVFKELNIPIKIEFYPWKRCEEMAKNKEVTGIFTLGKSIERESYLIYPNEPVNISQNVFFYKNGKKYKFNSLSDLKGLTVGITAGYNYYADFDKSTLFTKDPANSDDLNFKKLDAGRIDLFVCDKLVGVYLLKQMNLNSQITFLPKPLSEVKMYLGLTKTKENEQLAKKFDEGLRKIKKNGIYDKILAKYTK